MLAGSFDTTHSETPGRWHFNFERFQDRHPAGTFRLAQQARQSSTVFHRHFFPLLLLERILRKWAWN